MGRLDLSVEQRSQVAVALKTFGVARTPATKSELNAATALAAQINDVKLAKPINEITDDDKVAIIAELAERRFCGVPDAQRVLTATAAAPSWDKGDLTWRVNTTGAQINTLVTPLSIPTLGDALELAFETWRQALPSVFTFRKVTRNADIAIDFTLPFDNSRPFLLATGGTSDGKGNINFRPGRPQNDTGDVASWDMGLIALVATHEIGHVLGLYHSNLKSSLMFPISGGWAQGTLDPETRNRIRDLYAWQPRDFPDGRASAYSPALATTTAPGGLFGAPPASVTHMVWTGREGHAALSYSRSDDDGRTWSPPLSMRWPDGATPVHGTALTSYCGGDDPAPNKLFLAWAGDRDQLWYAPSVEDPTDLRVFALEGHSSDERPALAHDGRVVHMVWKSNGDDRVWWGTWNRGRWSTVHAIPGLHTDSAPAVVVSARRVRIIVREPGADGRLVSSWKPTSGRGQWRTPASLRHFEYKADGAYDSGYATSRYGPAAATVVDSEYMMAFVDPVTGAVSTMRHDLPDSPLSVAAGEANPVLGGAPNKTGPYLPGSLSGPTPTPGSRSDRPPAIAHTGSGTMCSWIESHQRIRVALRPD